MSDTAASFFSVVRISLRTILVVFSTNYFWGLGLRIRVMVRDGVWVRVTLRVKGSLGLSIAVNMG